MGQTFRTGQARARPGALFRRGLRYDPAVCASCGHPAEAGGPEPRQWRLRGPAAEHELSLRDLSFPDPNRV